MTVLLFFLLLLHSAFTRDSPRLRESEDQTDPEGGTIFPSDDEYNELPEGPGDADMARAALPVNFTYRDHKCVQIINQGSCGCCYAAATVEMVTVRRCLQFNDSKLVSLEDLVTCDYTKYLNVQNNGCRGGNALASLKFGETTGMVYDTCEDYWNRTYPYPTETCKTVCKDNHSKDRTIKNKAPYRLSGVDAMMRDIYQNGPIAVSMYLANDFPPKDKKSIYVSGPKTKLSGGHAVMIVGWGEENGVPYWDCANTYGTNWGDHGYFKIKRGSNELKIETWPGAALPIASDSHPETPSNGTISVETGKTYIAGYEVAISYKDIAIPAELQLKSEAGAATSLVKLTSSSGTARVTIPRDTTAGTYYLTTKAGDAKSARFSLLPYFTLAFDKASYEGKKGESITLRFTTSLQTPCKLMSGSSVLLELNKGVQSCTVPSSLSSGRHTLTLTTTNTVPTLSTSVLLIIEEKHDETAVITITAPTAGAKVMALAESMRVSYTTTGKSGNLLLQAYCGDKLKDVLAAGLSSSGSIDIRLPSAFGDCSTVYLRLRSESSPFVYADVGPLNVTSYSYLTDDLPAPSDKDEPTPDPDPQPDPEPEPEPEPTPDPTGDVALSISEPSAQTVWTPGGAVTIRWTSNLTASNEVTILLYELVGSKNYLRHTFTRTAPNTGLYTDTLPASVPSGPNYFVRLRSSNPVFTNTSENFAVKASKYLIRDFPDATALGDPLSFTISRYGFALLSSQRRFSITVMHAGEEVCTLDETEGAIGLNTIYLDSCAEKMQRALDGKYYLKLCSRNMECIMTPTFTVLDEIN
ncbi:Cathepsin B-like cysteine proteinase [Giardia duodenalis assemblage B]|uniref:Cathepsin B-like cysteine proteinase n=1 Tax=Giardia duodenalis assemblage B TaxID=1394984 RepID=A0A132NQB6_GIAIN|nr:Cathepsin B-like cysteine proteinase [Giardia intestinalis assemblage B]